MKELYRDTERSHDKNDSGPRGPLSLSWYTEEHQNGEKAESANNRDNDYDEEERFVRAFNRWLRVRFFQAKLIDIVGIVTGIILAAVGIVATFVYYGQLQAMRDTNKLTQVALDKANSNSADSSKQFLVQLGRYDATLGQTQIIAKQTQAQAEQMSKLAKHTEELAAQAKAQADASNRIATNAAIQSTATQSLATNSAEQLQTMQAQLEITDRPWIRVKDVTIDKDFPLQWAKVIHGLADLTTLTSRMTMLLNVRVSTENVGKSVAVDYAVYTRLIFSGTPDNYDLQAQQTYFCDAVLRKETASNRIGDAYFSGESRNELEEPDGAILSKDAWGSDKGDVLPYIIGCVVYRFQTSKTIHQTRFLYQIINSKRMDNGMLRIGENLSSESIRLERIPGLDYAY